MASNATIHDNLYCIEPPALRWQTCDIDLRWECWLLLTTANYC